MPEQPADPKHYEMKIPPRKKEEPEETGEVERGSDEVTAESNAEGEKKRPRRE